MLGACSGWTTRVARKVHLIVWVFFMWFAVILSILLLSVGLVALRLSRRDQARTGLPSGTVVYSDTGAWQRVEKPLRSRRYGIVGKPDYLVEIAERGRKLTIPVEVKSRRRPAVPYEGHVLQLGAYCLLVEEQSSSRPPYGLLRYADATIQIPFTDALRWQVLETAESIRHARSAANLSRDHQDANRCRGCGYRASCGDESL
jgi:CRISPR-associated exonuclease Cas4